MKTRLSASLLVVFESILWIARAQQIEIYGKIGHEVVLKPPGSDISDFEHILWYHKSNFAVEWDRKENQSQIYTHFQDRSSLNILTGELTIRDLTEKLGGVYTVKINRIILKGSINLKVISAVPKPRINASCNEEKTSCDLICEGNVSEMDPKPTYTWKLNTVNVTPTPNNILRITPETSANDFVCELENPVSYESSPRFYNPFIKDKAAEVDDSPKINTGIIVFASLLACVVGVALLHRVKSGMWFFQKDSMPWEADFWKKTESVASSQPQPANDDTERNTMMESNS